MEIPNTKQIQLHFHCANCSSQRPDGTSPKEWASLDAGWTRLGLQVWCKRCDMNIIHIDFEKHQHPANTTGTKYGRI